MVKEELIAQEFTPVYDEREDRIRLIINIHYPTRYDLFLTRKLLLKLVEKFSSLLQENINPVSNINIQNGANTTQNLQKTYPPTNKEVKVIEKITINHIKEKNVYQILIYDKNVVISTSLSPSEFKNLLSLIVSKVKYEWGIYI